MCRRFKAIIAVALAMWLTAAAAEAGGKVVVSNDEWPLSDVGFDAAPSARQLALNLARFFVGNRRGNFLVYSPNFGLNGQALAATMREAGHTWTVRDPAAGAVDLSPYDAVFVGERLVEADVLKAYVRNGGNVYVVSGTGFGVADDLWNEFLHAYGLDLAPYYNSVVGLTPTSSTHEIFAGVSEVLYDTGNSVRVLASSRAQVIEQTNGEGLFAVSTEALVSVPVTLCSQRASLRRTSRGALHVTISGTRDVAGTDIDLASLRLVGIRPSAIKIFDTKSRSTQPARPCAGHSDGVADVLLTFDARQIAEAVWSQLVAPPVVNGEIVVLTLTGTLKPSLGRAALYGETDLELKTK